MKDLEAEYARRTEPNCFACYSRSSWAKLSTAVMPLPPRLLELTEGNARQWVLRMRRRYGERLRERIAETA